MARRKATPDVIREQLAATAGEVRKANSVKQAALVKLGKSLRTADEAGISVVDMAKLTGVSRTTVYRLMGDWLDTASAAK